MQTKRGGTSRCLPRPPRSTATDSDEDYVSVMATNHRAAQSIPSLLKNILFRISVSRSSFVQLTTSM